MEDNEISYFGVLHIGRIIWEIESNNFKKNIEETIKHFEDKKIDLTKQYKEAIRVIKKIIKKQKDIEDLGHYFSRIELDKLIFEEYNSKKN